MERWGVARLEAPPADRAWEQLKKRLPMGFSNNGYCLVQLSLDGGRGDHGGRRRNCDRACFLV